jgi:hypothetical protein
MPSSFVKPRPATATDCLMRITRINTNLSARRPLSSREHKRALLVERGGSLALGEIRVHSCCYPRQAVRGRGAKNLSPLRENHRDLTPGIARAV